MGFRSNKQTKTLNLKIQYMINTMYTCDLIFQIFQPPGVMIHFPLVSQRKILSPYPTSSGNPRGSTFFCTEFLKNWHSPDCHLLDFFLTQLQQLMSLFCCFLRTSLNLSQRKPSRYNQVIPTDECNWREEKKISNFRHHGAYFHRLHILMCFLVTCHLVFPLLPKCRFSSLYREYFPIYQP